MMVTFAGLTFLHERKVLMETLSVVMRATPLVFLLVSVYFENRTEFYDLVIKRGIIMLLSLVAVAATFAISLEWLGQMPGGMARPWLFAVVLLPVVMLLPWMHDRVGRLLDRLWFGREFTPVEAIKHVLGGMQQATDEASLVAASQDTLSEMFRRPMAIVMDDQPLPPDRRRSTWRSRVHRRPFGSRPAAAVGRPLLSEDLALLRSLGGVFAFMLENVRLQRKRQEQDQVAQELRLQTSRSELKALRAQINPHFLFNALNAIASLIHTDPARADAAVEQLAEVFRYTLRRSEQEWAPLDQELAFARAYLDVEQARFGRRLEFSIDAAPEVARAQVPSMLLQTLVENAVKHGISRVRTPGRIEVTASQQAGELTLEVRDTGPGIETTQAKPSPSGESFGLRSVRDRLEGHFGHAGIARSLQGERADNREDPHAADSRAHGRGRGGAMIVRAFIVDDEPPARVRLRQLLAEVGDVLVVGEAGDAVEARDSIVETRPDVVFLDIEMPEESGTDLAATLPEPRPFVVFATAFERYALAAFAVDATDYLVKPITRARLSGTLEARARAAVEAIRPRASIWSRHRRLKRCSSSARCRQSPATIPAAITIPARGVGGDFFISQQIDDTRSRAGARRRIGQGHASGDRRLQPAGPYRSRSHAMVVARRQPSSRT